MVQILVKERAFWHGGAGAASQREVVPFVTSGSICHMPLSCLRILQDESIPSAPLGLVSLLRSPKMQEGIAPPRVVILPVLQTGLMSNFCSFLLAQGLPSPRFRNCHPAASHSAAYLLKNRYGGMSQSCSGKLMGVGGPLCPAGARGLMMESLIFGFKFMFSMCAGKLKHCSLNMYTHCSILSHYQAAGYHMCLLYC